MTRTLTLERQQFEKWWETAMHNGYPPRFGWEHWRDGDGYRDDDGEFQGLWQAWQASRGFLANREAQPVGKAEITKIAAELVRGDYLSKLWTEAEKSRHVNTHRLQSLLDELHDVMKVKAIAITQLLTAPPAPVVVKLPAEFYSGEGIVVRLEEVMAALAVVGVQFERKANVKTRCEFPAPAVPKEMTVEQAYENVQTWHYANGWNACRAAMLAAAPEGGNG